MNKMNEIGIKVPEIFLPKDSVDLSKYSVVACDQYTSEPKYWQEVDEFVGDSVSTLRMTLPEIYLESSDKQVRIDKVNEKMQEYLANGSIQSIGEGFVLVKRKTRQGKLRKGLVVALDLEFYDYSKNSQTLIRATEGTVVERIPPRLEIRRHAKIELPHIMVLIDDPDRTVIEPLFEQSIIERLKKIYDFDLMMDSGHLEGFQISDSFQIEKIVEALTNLANSEKFKNKYNVGEDKGVLLFAMGDGNHSLATAKALWEETKINLAKEEQEYHPARYALVELVNVHDEGLEFEPIHRVLFGVKEDIHQLIKEYFESKGIEIYFSKNESLENFDYGKLQAFEIIVGKNKGVYTFQGKESNLSVGSLQLFLNEISTKKGYKIDYIHGRDVVEQLSSEASNVGFIVPGMEKDELFKTVILDGALPRKTFSMGEAHEKRFYLEARKIAI